MSKPRTTTTATLDDVLRSLVASEVASKLEPLVERVARIQAQIFDIKDALARHPSAANSAETWIDVKTARAKTSLGSTKLAEMIADGTLESTKVGGRRLIATSSIDALMRGPAS